jgi:iron complex transport system permease protein
MAKAGRTPDAKTLQAARLMFSPKVRLAVKLVIVTALFAAFLASFMIGRYPVMPAELVQIVWAHFFDPDSLFASKADTAIFNIRLPRVLVVMLAGAALAMAGASYQGMFKNPLVSPDLLGASAGASLGACLALLLNLPSLMVQLFAFCGGIIAVLSAVWLNKMVRYDPVLGLVLGGILVSTLFQSGTSIVKLLADANDKLPAITFWLMGSFAGVDNHDLYLCIVPLVIGFVILLLQSWKLNVLSFGEEEARSMGVNTGRTRLLVIVASTLLTSTSVAVAGIVGWIGLVIPHLARAIVGPNYKVLLPTTMFVGAAYLLLVDDIARMLSSVEIPIGILTSVLGVPFFVVIFRRNMSGWR